MSAPQDDAPPRRRRRAQDARNEPQAVDFRRPPRPSGAQLEAVEAAAGRLAMRLQAAIAAFFRRSFKVVTKPVEVQHFQVLVEEAPQQTWFLPLAAPSGAHGVLALDPALQSDLVERFLGAPDPGPADAGYEAQQEGLDDEIPIEVATHSVGAMSRSVLEPFVVALLREMNGVLGEASADDRLELDANRRALPPQRMLRNGDVVAQLRFEIKDGARGGMLSLHVVSRALSRMIPVDEAPHDAPVAAPTAREHLERVVRGVGVPLVVKVGGAVVELPEFLRIRPGDVLVLDRRVGEPLAVEVGGKEMFRARPGRSNGRFAVRLADRAEESR